jgi:hypothetical protein
LAYPDIAFTLFPLEPLMPLFTFGGWNTHQGLLGHAPQDLARLGTHRQHPLHEKPPSAFVADVSRAADLVTMRQIDGGGILYQQHHGIGIRLLPGLVQVRLHQSRTGHIWLDLRNRYKALVSLQVCM